MADIPIVPTDTQKLSLSLAAHTAGTNRKCCDPEQWVHENDRPRSAWERCLGFGTSVGELWKDYQLYQNINDASTTPRNVWTNNNGGSSAAATLAATPSTIAIPWRQRLQQRQFVNDITRVLPIVLMWAVPVVGNIPMLVSVFFPQQLLSRQFHNRFEAFAFARCEARQRRKHSSLLAEAFVTYFSVSFSEEDRVFDADALSESELMSFLEENLQTAGLALGLFQSQPPQIAEAMAMIAPKTFLRRYVHELFAFIGEDDALLLTEGNLESECRNLTEIEVLDSCSARGLPVDGSTEDMRLYLVAYLADEKARAHLDDNLNLFKGMRSTLRIIGSTKCD